MAGATVTLGDTRERNCGGDWFHAPQGAKKCTLPLSEDPRTDRYVRDSGFAIEPIAVVDYLDLVGPAIPLADEMGAGRNGPCGSAGAWCLVRHGSQSAPGCGRKPAMGPALAFVQERTRRRKTRESELGGVAPKVCSQTRRKLAKSKPSKTTFRPTPVSCGITERSLLCSIKSSLMRDFRVRSSLPVARPAADLGQPCAPPVGLSPATRSPGVGSQPCGAKYPRFCADSKGV